MISMGGMCVYDGCATHYLNKWLLVNVMSILTIMIKFLFHHFVSHGTQNDDGELRYRALHLIVFEKKYTFFTNYQVILPYIQDFFGIWNSFQKHLRNGNKMRVHDAKMWLLW